MITCPKCNKELSDGTKFCDGCGAKIFKTIFCPNCGKQTSTEFAFCQSCGASVTEPPTEEQPAAVPTEKKKLPKKAIMFGGIGVAVVAVLILVISLFFGGAKAENNYALYLKDSEIFFTDLKKDSKAWQLTSRLVGTDEVDDKDLADAGYRLGLYTYMSEDGKYIFFPDKVGDKEDGFNLYYKEVAKPDMEAIKVDSDIRSYTVNTSATLITYLKGEEGNLYQYKIGEDSKEKIASEVKGFEVSDDGKKIGYINSENSIYLKYADKEKEKIASDVSTLEHVTEDFSAVYYIKDGSLYKQVEVEVEGEDKVKITSDVYDVIKIYDSGEIYYLKSEAEEISLMNYVTDDMKDADASISEPSYPDYPNSPSRPSWWDYDTAAEYDAAYAAYEDAYEAWEAECDRIETEYYAAREAYYAKQSRDELRENLAEKTLEQSSYSLCFYNGTEEVVITDTFVGGDYSKYTYASEAPVISYEAYNQSSLEKVKLSEVESVYDIESMVKAALFSSSERYIAVKGTATVVEQEKEATNFRIKSSGTIVYYIDDIPEEKNYGELYHISIKNGVVGKAEVYDSDVYTGYCYFVSDTELEYFKDCKDGKGELYINKNKIDYDVYCYSVDVYSHLDKIFYFTDWNDEKGYGTLKVYDGKEAAKIADDVHSFSVTPDGRVLYLYDYSLNYYKGELHEWSNGEKRKIDDDVVFVLPILYSKYRGYTYSW